MSTESVAEPSPELSRAEAAALAGLRPQTLSNLVSLGFGPPLVPGCNRHRPRFRRADVLAWIEHRARHRRRPW